MAPGVGETTPNRLIASNEKRLEQVRRLKP